VVSNPDVKWVKVELTNAEAVAALIETHGVSGAIHTAAVPNESVARPDPFGTVNSNVGAVAGLLEQARRRNWCRFIYVSSGSVFQKADGTTPILEDAPPAPTTVYSTTKFCGELVTTMFRSQYDLSAATVRISWVYGPPLVPRVRDNPRGPIPWFLKCALGGEALVEPSGGDFAASFTHVSDVAAGLLAAYETTALRHPVYHLGSGLNFSTSRVADAVRNALPGVSISVGPGTAPWTDHTRMRGPLAGTWLFEDAGFKPKFDLEHGVHSFADWMQANRGAWA
jgi:nucleoside-diphosphate-sugar epimerase